MGKKERQQKQLPFIRSLPCIRNCVLHTTCVISHGFIKVHIPVKKIDLGRLLYWTLEEGRDVMVGLSAMRL